MKRAYWFLLLFGIWCAASAIWYLFAVKGLTQDLHYFNPHSRLVAISEIMLMLLIACLIGYAIGVATRDEPLEALQETIGDLEIEKKSAVESKQELIQQLAGSRQDLQHIRQSGQEQVDRANRQADALRAEMASVQRELGKMKIVAANLPTSEALENEANALRFRTKQLEFQNQELEEAIGKLKHELELSIALHSRKTVEPVHPFVRPATEEEKDDLTVIKGIGPFIEKRLNMVGIYTLRQISEFTPTTIEQVTKAIEFFPNRMAKDDWVGQAKALIS